MAADAALIRSLGRAAKSDRDKVLVMLACIFHDLSLHTITHMTVRDAHKALDERKGAPFTVETKALLRGFATKHGLTPESMLFPSPRVFPHPAPVPISRITAWRAVRAAVTAVFGQATEGAWKVVRHHAAGIIATLALAGAAREARADVPLPPETTMSAPFNPRDLFFASYAKKAPEPEASEAVEEVPEEPVEVNHRDLFFGVGSPAPVQETARRQATRPPAWEEPAEALPGGPELTRQEVLDDPAGDVDPVLLAELADVEPDPDADDRAAALERVVLARRAEQADMRARLASGPSVEAPGFGFGTEPSDVTEAVTEGAPAALRSKQVTLSRRLARYVLRMEVRDAPIDSDFFWSHDDLPTVQRAFARAGLPWLPLFGVVQEQD